MTDLWLATANKKKRAELVELTRQLPVQIHTVDELSFPFEVVEDQHTFQGNAQKKAEALVKLTGSWSLADDSGLEVVALDNRPGVFSARYAGDHATDSDNNRKLLQELEAKTNRQARFRCVLCLAGPGGIFFSEGTVSGRIVDAPTGSGGFGYDPLFIPDGYNKTFAELGSEVKNTISHRAVALKGFLPLFHQIFT